MTRSCSMESDILERCVRMNCVLQLEELGSDLIRQYLALNSETWVDVSVEPKPLCWKLQISVLRPF